MHLFTTHLQASYKYNNDALNALNDAARLQQIAEMGAFMRRKLHTCGCNGPVVVAGDLNVNARPYSPVFTTTCGVSQEYTSMMQILKESSGMHVRDILLEAHPSGHPITYGDVHIDAYGAMRPADTVLTAPEDHCSMLCLDYILLLEPQTAVAEKATRIDTDIVTPHDYESHVTTASTQTMASDTKVEKFEVKCGEHPFGYLSDHYGISTVLSAVCSQ